MSSYAESVLANGEQILHVAVISHWKYALNYFLGVFFVVVGMLVILMSPRIQGLTLLYCAVPMLVGALLIVMALVNKKTTKLVLTNRRMITKRGLIARDTVEMNLGKVESVRVSQGLLGRILNFGDVTVVGTGASPEPLRGIANPLELRRKLGEVMGVDTPGK